MIATHLSQMLQENAHELIGHEEVQELMEVLKRSSPKLVENLTPKPLALSVISRVMQNLLQEQVSIDGRDAIITDPATGHRLLVRVHKAPKGVQLNVGKNSFDVWSLGVEAEGIAVRFEIILIPLRKAGSADEPPPPAISM